MLESATNTSPQRGTGVSLQELAKATGGRIIGRSVEVADLTHDSRQCAPGMMFACVVGSTYDGHTFASQAVRSGAVALLTQHPLELQADVPQLVVSDVRRALGACAAAVHRHPARRLQVVGVTGTSGKTTVSQAITQVLNSAGRVAEVLGTLDGLHTTPEATDLNRWLARLASTSQADPTQASPAQPSPAQAAAVIEVSSHALALGRVDGIDFAAGVFTNLSSEHLDFHQTMEEYFQAKAKLFDGRSALAVVNVGNEWGVRLIEQIGDTVPVIPYTASDLVDVEVTPSGLRFSWRNHRITSDLLGRFNLENLAATAATCLALGLDEAQVAAGLAKVKPVPGRMQPVVTQNTDGAQLAPFVLVDYAHKPEALSQALQSARELAKQRRGQLWVVFGAGGDRDRSKRPLMGSAAANLADYVVITSDNPRSEDPDQIAAEIEAGFVTAQQHGASPIQSKRILDRRDAIAYAITQAAKPDVVLVAGKGHETTQTGKSGVLPFDDAQVAADLLLTAAD